jgi:hypothetical protein
MNEYGKLKIVARLGELMPASPPGDRGQGRRKKGANGEKKSSSSCELDFASATSARSPRSRSACARPRTPGARVTIGSSGGS